MALFNREDENPENPSVSPPSRTPVAQKVPSGERSTYIGPGVKIKGEISANAEVVVDGEVQGRLELQDGLIVGSEGVVDGDIVARSVQVGGKVVGNVRGTDRFELLKSGRIEGDVVSPRVVIAEGAYFKGSVEMASQPAPSAPALGASAPGKVTPQVDNTTSRTDESSPSPSTGTGTGSPK